jgi:DNA-3-methyladenine glycosylase
MEGLELMASRRMVKRAVDFARGPGRLTVAMGVDRSLDGIDLCSGGPLWLGGPARDIGEIGVSARIGLSRAAERLLRFYERGNPFVSGTRKQRE